MSQLIDRIFTRCLEIGDCWEWQGALHKRGRTPVINYQGKPSSVRRVLAMHLGHNCTGRLASNSCLNPICVNPKHIQLILRQTLQRRIAREREHYYLNQATRAKIAARQRDRSKLTMDIVQDIRDDPRPQRTVAKVFGVSQSTVSGIKRGVRWQDFNNPFMQLIKL
jgi:predicted XRE-type DNA-binding protein